MTIVKSATVTASVLISVKVSETTLNEVKEYFQDDYATLYTYDLIGSAQCVIINHSGLSDDVNDWLSDIVIKDQDPDSRNSRAIGTADYLRLHC